jgi:hypothetical protein
VSTDLSERADLIVSSGLLASFFAASFFPHFLSSLEEEAFSFTEFDLDLLSLMFWESSDSSSLSSSSSSSDASSSPSSLFESPSD